MVLVLTITSVALAAEDLILPAAYCDARNNYAANLHAEYIIF